MRLVGEDAQLLRRMAAGDDSALAEIFDRYAPLVLGLARRVTGSSELAEDIVQEVFTALWSRPERFDPARGTLRAYLGVITHRRAVDRVRQSERQRRRDETSAWEGPLVAADGTDLALTAEIVRQAIERLPDGQRQAVELAYWKGLTHCEVAAAMGLPEGTVKSRLRLASAKLRDWLAPLAVVES